MLVYILKFSSCLAIFLAFYKLFLERENMHQFKRFYLIAIVLTSIAIPFITFTEYIEPESVLDSLSTTTFLTNDTLSIENETSYLPIILWTIYAIGVLLFGLKFGFNLVQMILKIKKNPKLKSSNFINVLLQDLVTPHTFFSYIFLNKHKYETSQIPQEVLLHEQTHAKQKHSIDVLFIEFLQVIFWFNPLIHFIKKSIKLNHEFLADNAVLKNGVQANNYQHILLSFSFYKNEAQLANAINYSSIKKRITVMKTQTSKQKIWLRSFILLPLLALTLYSFSSRIEIIKEKNDLELLEKNNEFSKEMTSQVVNENQDGASREQMKEYERLAKYYNSLPKDQLIIKKDDIDRMKYIYHLMSDKQKKDAEPFPNIPPPPPPIKPNVPKAMETQEVMPPPPPPIPDNATPKQRKKYEEAIRKYKIATENSKQQTEVRVLSKEEVAKLKKEKEAYKNRQKLEIAQIKEAKSAEVVKLKKEKIAYQEARLAKIKTEKGELTRVRELRSKEEVQKLKEEKLAYQEARAAKLKTEKRELAQVKKLRKEEDVLRLKQEKLAYAEAQRAKLSTEERLVRVKEIKTPEPPKSPLDHVVDMAKKDAKFYLEGKEISSDKALDALKKNKSLNIRTIDSDSKQPKVYITKKPIIIEN